MQERLHSEIAEEQAGFRPGKGTRDQILGLKMLLEKNREVERDVYLCFIDYRKALDTVVHEVLWNVMKEMGFSQHVIDLIRNLYMSQKATIRTTYGTTDNLEIGQGVRQGCILSPHLFNIYAEHVMRKALEHHQTGIKVGGRLVNNLRYADDVVLVASSIQELQDLTNKVKTVSEAAGLFLNVNKTKVMKVTKTPSNDILIVDNQHVEIVEVFKYLGAMLTNNLDDSVERNSIARLRHHHHDDDVAEEGDQSYNFLHATKQIPTSTQERQRLVALLESQSNNISQQLKQLQLEGDATSAAIQAVKSGQPPRVFDNPSWLRVKKTAVAGLQLPTGDVPVDRMFDACWSSRLPNTISDSFEPNGERRHAEGRQDDELETLRLRQAALTDKITQLQKSRVALMHNLGHLIGQTSRLPPTSSPSVCSSNQPSTSNLASKDHLIQSQQIQMIDNHRTDDLIDWRCSRLLREPDKQSTGPESTFSFFSNPYSSASTNDRECQTDSGHQLTLESEPITTTINNDQQPSSSSFSSVPDINSTPTGGHNISALAAIAAMAAASFFSSKQLPARIDQQRQKSGSVGCVTSNLPNKEENAVMYRRKQSDSGQYASIQSQRTLELDPDHSQFSSGDRDLGHCAQFAERILQARQAIQLQSKLASAKCIEGDCDAEDLDEEYDDEEEETYRQGSGKSTTPTLSYRARRLCQLSPRETNPVKPTPIQVVKPALRKSNTPTVSPPAPDSSGFDDDDGEEGEEKEFNDINYSSVNDNYSTVKYLPDDSDSHRDTTQAGKCRHGMQEPNWSERRPDRTGNLKGVLHGQHSSSSTAKQTKSSMLKSTGPQRSVAWIDQLDPTQSLNKSGDHRNHRPKRSTSSMANNRTSLIKEYEEVSNFSENDDDDPCGNLDKESSGLVNQNSSVTDRRTNFANRRSDANSKRDLTSDPCRTNRVDQRGLQFATGSGLDDCQQDQHRTRRKLPKPLIPR